MTSGNMAQWFEMQVKQRCKNVSYGDHLLSQELKTQH